MRRLADLVHVRSRRGGSRTARNDAACTQPSRLHQDPRTGTASWQETAMKSSVPRRRSIRLRDFDYASEGLYFVTICTDRRVAIFGEIVAQEMVLNDFGKIVEEIWRTMFHIESNSKNWIVMPNHLHGIIAMMDDIDGSRITPEAKPLGRLVGAFKTASTNRVNKMFATPGAAVWQRNFLRTHHSRREVVRQHYPLHRG